MHFSDIVKDSEGCLSTYEVMPHVNMVAWKPEVHFRKSAKSRVPDSKSPD